MDGIVDTVAIVGVTSEDFWRSWTSHMEMAFDSVMAGPNRDSNEEDSQNNYSTHGHRGRGCGCNVCMCRLAHLPEEPPRSTTFKNNDVIAGDQSVLWSPGNLKMDDHVQPFFTIDKWLLRFEGEFLQPSKNLTHESGLDVCAISPDTIEYLLLLYDSPSTPLISVKSSQDEHIEASIFSMRDPQFHHMAHSPTENQFPPLNHHHQGATCQPLKTTSPLQHYQQTNFLPGASWPPNPTMQAFTPTSPIFAFDSSPDQQYSDMEGFTLDYDILNNPTYLDDFNLAEYYNDFSSSLTESYGDFTLFPTNESFIQSPFPTNEDLFPSLPSYDSPESVAATTTANPFPSYDSPASATTHHAHRFQCQFASCTESFPRQCELTRHEYKHTRPFKCPHCGRAFAEKRRCVQHVQAVHDLATEKDKTKCQLCKYAHVRPDAVKRHLRLKHGVGAKMKTSPSLSEQSSQGPGRRKGGG